MLRSAHGSVTFAQCSPEDRHLTGTVRQQCSTALLRAVYACFPHQPSQDILKLTVNLEAVVVVHTATCPSRYWHAMSTLVRVVRCGGAGLFAKVPLCRLWHGAPAPASGPHAGGRDAPSRDAGVEVRLQGLFRRVDMAADAAAERAAAVQVSHLLRCPKCKTTEKLQVTAHQNRSADEGMTSQGVCMECGYKWKLG